MQEPIDPFCVGLLGFAFVAAVVMRVFLFLNISRYV